MKTHIIVNKSEDMEKPKMVSLRFLLLWKLLRQYQHYKEVQAHRPSSGPGLNRLCFIQVIFYL